MQNSKKKRNFNQSARWLIFFATLFFLALVVYLGSARIGLEWREGDVATRDIYSPFDFVYQSGIDRQKTEKLKDEAMSRVLDTYDMDPKVLESQLVFIEKFFDSKDIKEKLKKILEELYALPIISNEQKQRLFNLKNEAIILRKFRAQSAEDIVKIKDIPTKSETEQRLQGLTAQAFAGDKKTKAALLKLSEQLIQPNLRFNQEETQNRKKKAADLVGQQIILTEVKKNQLIIAKGQKVGKEHLAQFRHLERPASKTNKIINFLSLVLIISVLMALAAKYLKAFEKKIYQDTNILSVLCIITLYTVILAKIIIAMRLSSYVIPLASSAMLIAILVSTRAAVIFTIILSILVAMMLGAERFDIMAMFFVGGIAGILAVFNVRRRFKILQAGLLVGVINFIFISARGISNNFSYDIFLTQGWWGFANGIASAFIVAGILPLFETGFKLTTNITLLELSDLNHPLLKELFVKAAGTYHHSIVVGNLAEAASEEIGANSLLARVGSYYHDIGKMEKPQYFSENQVEVKSKHERLAPTMSSLIITNHVKYGVELAKKHKLNREIIDFISQHHGTATIFYFFQRALEKVEDEKTLKEEGFRYPGPKPQTKEVAIVLLADSVEAASRTLKDPTPSRLRELVQRIINNKFIDGQLEECDLTLKDLNSIANIFTKILTGIYHRRVEYPTGQETGDAD